MLSLPRAWVQSLVGELRQKGGGEKVPDPIFLLPAFSLIPPHSSHPDLCSSQALGVPSTCLYVSIFMSLSGLCPPSGVPSTVLTVYSNPNLSFRTYFWPSDRFCHSEEDTAMVSEKLSRTKFPNTLRIS